MGGKINMELNIKMRPVVNVSNLSAVLQNNIPEYCEEYDELRTLFWPEDFMNDCYKTLYFDDDYDVSENYEGEERRRVEAMNKAFEYLRNYFGSNVDSILVDVSW